jgi:hypothetical protein
VVTPPVSACLSVHCSTSKAPIFLCLESQWASALFGSGACCPQMWHWSFAWPAECRGPLGLQAQEDGRLWRRAVDWQTRGNGWCHHCWGWRCGE